MEIIEWNERLVSGIKKIDDDHKNLIGYYNEFFTACYCSMGPAVINDIIIKLVEYAKDHYQREEELMEREGYPGLTEMKNEHESLIRTIAELQEKVKLTSLDDVSKDTFVFLKDRLVPHMKELDGAFAKFVHEKR
jgi:hemerythrin